MLSPADALSRLQWRYAVKKFDPARRVPDADWRHVEDSMVLTPSSFGLQPWKFVVVTDQATKERLVPVSWGQKQVADCSHMVVIAARTDLSEADIDRHVSRTAEVRNTTPESLGGFRKMMVGSLVPAKFDLNKWAAHQCYIALGQLMAVAAVMGIDTCPMEGFEPAKYDEILGLTPLGYHSVVCCPVGYRAADDKNALAPKVRFNADDVVLRI